MNLTTYESFSAITTVEDSKSNPSRHDFHSPAPFASNVPKFGREIPNRVFVGALDANVTEDDLMEFFSKYGRIVHTKVVRDRANVSKGFGFATFENIEDAMRLKQEAGNVFLNGKKLNIGAAVEKIQNGFPRDIHFPLTPGHLIIHPRGFTYYVHTDGNTYFFPTFSIPPQFPNQVSKVPPHFFLRSNLLDAPMPESPVGVAQQFPIPPPIPVTANGNLGTPEALAQSFPTLPPAPSLLNEQQSMPTRGAFVAPFSPQSWPPFFRQPLVSSPLGFNSFPPPMLPMLNTPRPLLNHDPVLPPAIFNPVFLSRGIPPLLTRPPTI